MREAWHRGRRWYHVWVLDLDDAVRPRIGEVRAALGESVVGFSDTTPHVTVWVHGFDPSWTPHPWEGRSWPLEVGGANAFLSCPFLEVRGGFLPELRAGFAGVEERWAAWLPHVTVGRFAASLPTGPVAHRLRPLRGLPRLRTTATLRHGVVDAWAEGGDVLPLSATA